LESTATTAFQHYFDTVTPILAPPDTFETLNQKRPIIIIGDGELTKQVYQFLSPSISIDQLMILEEHGKLFSELQNLNDDWLHDGLLLAEKVEKFKPWMNSFIIFVQNPANPILANKFNRIAYQLNIPWIHAAIDGPFLFVGPTILPNRGACYECFETRIIMNLRESDSYQKYKKALIAGKVFHNTELTIVPALCGLLASHVAMEALNFVLTESTFTRNKVLSIYLPTMEIVFNEVFRISGCATCGSKPQRDDSQLYFDMKTLLTGEIQ
jgi:thiazole/oxazole-forming peptide maturase SagC family component